MKNKRTYHSPNNMAATCSSLATELLTDLSIKDFCCNKQSTLHQHSSQTILTKPYSEIFLVFFFTELSIKSCISPYVQLFYVTQHAMINWISIKKQLLSSKC